jgi:three-Cys-motif partner protein
MMVNAESGKLPEHYKGREQAYIKHRLLKAYLERLFMIVGRHHKTICYVDCFAGPWQEKSEKLEDTSIAISLEIIHKCREGLKNLGNDVQFKALFIEEDPTAYSKLENFLASKKLEGLSTKTLHGEFIALRQEILDWCGKDSFAFFFIDPTGWKHDVEPSTLEPLLKRHNSEFLINFMYDFLLRTHTQKTFENDMREIFGEVPMTEGMSPAEREEHLINLYRNNLKRIVPSSGGLPRTAYVKILNPIKDRTLYHLVYLTHHAKGITEFIEASEKLDIVQKKIRETAKQEHRIEKSGQEELFNVDVQPDDIGVDTDLSIVKEYWLNTLTEKPTVFDVKRLADMLEETGWFASDFQQAFKELEKDDKVKNLDAKRVRPINAVNFEKGERLIKINL